ncbi:MAG: hypothetical protein ACE5EX_05335, partial [Phycisphaerae bacterium]
MRASLLGLMSGMGMSASVQAQTIEYTVTDIPTVPEAFITLPLGINNSGEVVGRAQFQPSQSNPFTLRAWKWSAQAGLTLLPRPPGPDSSFYQAVDISDAGIIAGDTGVNTGLAWRFENGQYTFTGALPNTNAVSSAGGVNDAGDVAGTSGNTVGGRHAFMFTNASGIVDLTPAFSSWGTDINNARQVVGSTGFPSEAFRVSPGAGIEFLDLPPGAWQTFAGAINQAGDVVGSYFFSPNVSRAFLFTDDAGPRILPGAQPQPNNRNAATGINIHRVVVGNGSEGPIHGWVWTEQAGTRNLSDLIEPALGLNILTASGINNLGQIIATASDLDPLSSTRILLLTPILLSCTVDTDCDDRNACTDNICNVDQICTFPPNLSTSCDDGDACTLVDVCVAGVCVGTEPDCGGVGCRDCNGNGISDVCELPASDCNANGRPDDCDIANFTSIDCNDNGIPDECEVGPMCFNDFCDQAHVLCPGTVSGTTAGAGSDGSASCGASWTSPDLWYSYTPATDGTATFNTCGSSYDTVLSAHSGCPGDAANEITCDSGGTCGPFGSSITIGVVAGQTYMLRVSGFANFSGDYTLTTTGPGCIIDADCADRNPCTDDVCDVAGTCRNPDNTASCDDGDACTTADACLGGVCLGGPPIPCDGVGCADCNSNGVLDDCDIAGGASADTNGNGVPDECECLPAAAPTQGGIVAMNRYLSFSAVSAGERQAIRVTFVDIPPPNSDLNGSVAWVGAPQRVSENGALVAPDPQGRFADFNAATLACAETYLDWAAMGTVHVYHQAIVPGGVYSIQAVGEACGATAEASFSAVLSVTMSRWGDLVGP